MNEIWLQLQVMETDQLLQIFHFYIRWIPNLVSYRIIYITWEELLVQDGLELPFPL